MQSIDVAVSVGCAAIEESPDAPVEGVVSDLADSYVQTSARTP